MPGVVWSCRVAVLAAAAFLSLCATAQADRCSPPVREPIVHVTVDYGTVRYDNTRTREQIQAMAVGTAGRIGDGVHPAGLTVSEFATRISAAVQIRPISDSAYCVWLSELDVSLGYPEIAIYVDRRYARRSCQYAAILEHENQHRTINQRTLTAHFPAIRRRVHDIVDATPWLRAASEEAARNAYVTLVRDGLKETVDAFTADRERQHAVLDSPESYARTQALCRDW